MKSSYGEGSNARLEPPPSEQEGQSVIGERGPPPIPEEASRIRQYFTFLRPLNAEARLRNLEKRLGYTLAHLHSYPTLMEAPILPEGMQPADLPDTIHSCSNYFLAVDKCVQTSVERNKYTKGFPYARLAGCKPHWIRFTRCAQFRDRLVMKSSIKWEKRRFETLSFTEREGYVKSLEAKTRFLEFAALRTPHEQEKIKYTRELSHLVERLKALQQPSENASLLSSPSPSSSVLV
ncbi:hypothetical protein IE077_003869 [Cardiosporidium cionae]|uniref:PX domain-containing protein n=1 Tax=Cardiosporidium cionae TaxID=476202 RepID=A0ABQ7J7D2_9APIC|nr:hypothetical protein IE077_003869 [Cardiosporidium cionae]|eukprot:KAF8819873.1 hypothetical protein IE077_003869 [Cardiosporidium cionae]